MGRRGAGPGVAAVVVAVLVVLAGCNGLVPADTGDATPTETLTPVAVETPAPTATSAPPPAAFDWFLGNESVDTDTLLASHTRTLSNRSFVVVWSRQTSGGSGTAGEEYRQHIAVENDSTYSRRSTGTFSDGVVRTYVDASGVYRRVDTPNGSVETSAFPGGATGSRVRFALLIGDVAEVTFDRSDPRTGTVERGGARYYRLFSTDPPEYLDFVYPEYELVGFRSTVWVHPDGYVRAVQFDYTLENETGQVEVTERYAYSDVGETTVERPAWAAQLAGGNGSDAPRNGTVTPTPPANDTPMPTPSPDDTPTPTVVDRVGNGTSTRD